MREHIAVWKITTCADIGFWYFSVRVCECLALCSSVCVCICLCFILINLSLRLFFCAVVLGIEWQPVWKAAPAHPWWAASYRGCHSSQPLHHHTTSRRPWGGYDRLEHQFTGTLQSSLRTRPPPDPDCKSISALISFFSLERGRARESRREKDNRKESERETESRDSCDSLTCQKE